MTTPAAKVPLYKYFASSITLLTSAADGRGANVMACEWTMNVSYQPLRVMAMVEHADLTHELITASGEFGVNLCADDQSEMVTLAGRNSGRDLAKLDHEQFAGRTYPGARIKAPMLRGCVLNLECVVERTVEIGGYTAFIGKAVAGRANPRARPLLYFQSRFFQMGDEAVAAPPAKPDEAVEPEPGRS